jgi:hypothetical protein
MDYSDLRLNKGLYIGYGVLFRDMKKKREKKYEEKDWKSHSSSLPFRVSTIPFLFGFTTEQGIVYRLRSTPYGAWSDLKRTRFMHRLASFFSGYEKKGKKKYEEKDWKSHSSSLPFRVSTGFTTEQGIVYRLRSTPYGAWSDLKRTRFMHRLSLCINLVLLRSLHAPYGVLRSRYTIPCSVVNPNNPLDPSMGRYPGAA